MERGGRNASGTQGIHLILHEGDQWRHDCGQAGCQGGRELEAERFPLPRRHDGEDVAVGKDGFDDVLLAVAEFLKSEAPTKMITQIRDRSIVRIRHGRAEYTARDGYGVEGYQRVGKRNK